MSAAPKSSHAVDRVLIALSGGIESLVTAWLLKKQGKQLRGVHLDLFGTDEVAEKMKLFERKLGISIQVVNCKDEGRDFLIKEVENGMGAGRKIELKSAFHQRFLFPKLFELKEQYQIPKLATGHRVLLQDDSVNKLTRVYRYPEASADESNMMVGLDQSQVSCLELPLGAIPTSMISKIGIELALLEEARYFDLDWEDMLAQLRATVKHEGIRPCEVFTEEGERMGLIPDYTKIKVGDRYIDPNDHQKEYMIWDIDPSFARIRVGKAPRRKIRELHLRDASWFTRKDLGVEAVRCMMVSTLHEKNVPVKIIQFEGGRMKALLDNPLVGSDADIFNGQTVLWISGPEVLGGACVMACK